MAATLSKPLERASIPKKNMAMEKPNKASILGFILSVDSAINMNYLPECKL